MSQETLVPFKHQLEEVCKQMENCKTESDRRHLAFTKRLDDIVARQNRLTAARIRRLSLEGIEVNIDTIRGYRRENTFHGVNDLKGRHTPSLRRTKTDYEKDDACMINDKIKQSTIDCGKSEEVVKRPCVKQTEAYQQLYTQCRLELSFDSKHPKEPHSAKTSRTVDIKDMKGQRTKSFINDRRTITDQRNRTRLQRAFNNVLHAQKLGVHRRHTILSVAPVDIGQNFEFPSAIVYGKKEWNGTKANQSHGSPVIPIDRSSSVEAIRSSGKQKFLRVIKKMETSPKT